MAILLSALSGVSTLIDLYGKLKALWASTLTPEQKAQLTAEEERIFGSAAWIKSGLN